MAIYEPIRDGFREFNNMLIDSQQWEEKHKQMEHQKQMDHLRLQNGIEQQIFNNQMSVKAHQLAVSGDQRAAERLAFDILDTNRKWELNEKATKLGMQSTEELIKSSRLARLEKINSLQEYERNKAARPVLMAKAADEIFNTDPIADRETSFLNAQTKLSDIDKEIKSISHDGGIGQIQKGHLNRQKNQIKGEMTRIASSLSPAAKVKAWREQADKAMSLSIQFSDNKDNETAGRLVKQAEMFESRANTILSAQLAIDKERAKGTKTDPGLMTEAQMTNVKSFYESEGVMGGILGSDPVKPKMRHLSTIITRVHKDQLGGTPETRAIARADVINKVEEFETSYWQMVDKALAMSPAQRKELVIKLGLKYDPKVSNKDQIKNGYYLMFRDAVRGLVEDPQFQVYRPNQTTKQMTLGKSLGEK